MVFAVAAISISILVFSGHTDIPVSVSAQSTSFEANDDVIFRHLFRRIAFIKERADDIERRGGNAANLRNLFKRKLNLNEEQARILEQIAWQSTLETQAIDARAAQIAQAYRAQYPNGQVPHGQPPAPPPAELLRELSRQRNKMVLRKRDELRLAFGEEVFGHFRQFVKSNTASNVNFNPPGQ